MLSERTRNVIVGLTIIVAIMVCMYGIFLLGKLPRSALSQYKLTLITPSANGVTNGSRVEFNGVDAGTVKSVYPAKLPDDKLGVKVELSIDSSIEIPASAQASLIRPQAVGNAYVYIKATSAKPPMLSRGGTATLNADAPDSSLIPPEVFKDVHDLKADLAGLAHELSTVANDLHVLLAYTPPEALEHIDPNDKNHPVENVSTVIVRLNRTIQNLDKWLNDPKMQGNVREAMQNLADASARLKGLFDKFDAMTANANTAISGFSTAAGSINGAATQASATLVDVRKEVDRIAQRLVEVLGQFEKSARQLTEGTGTTGKLVNDPRLYEGLLDLSKSLKSTVEDLDFLLKKWKEEGLNIKL